jgi:hypothetical protein
VNDPIKTTLVTKAFTLASKAASRNYYYINRNYAVLKDSWISTSIGMKNVSFVSLSQDMYTGVDAALAS